MSDFSLRVVRADDLLILEFEFFNLRLDTSTPGIPQLVRVSPNDEARIVVHFQPQHVSEETFDENFGPPATSDRIRSFMTGTTRLAFSVPTGIAAIPLTIESLLDWQVLAPVRPARPDPPRAPAPDETAIEMPYRLVLSPTDAGQWSHRTLPFAPGGHAELWHTSRTDLQSEFGVTAVWSPDMPFAASPGGNPFPMSLGPADRIRIVQQSASPTLFAEVLRLSALGGWLRMRGPSWNHDLAMGRDQKVRTEQRGVLYPFGHAVTLVTTSERRFAMSNTGVRAAYLMQTAVLYIREPSRTYDDRAMPFKEMRITQTVVPIDVPASGAEPFVPEVSTRAFGFPITATDQVNRVHQFAAPMVYVPEGFADAATIQELYAGHDTVDLSSQAVAFAPEEPGTIAAPVLRDAAIAPPGPTALRTLAISFGGSIDASGALPVMKTASVGVPAAEQMFGASAQPVKIALNQAYVASGLSGTADQVFADIQDGLPLGLPAERAGGLAAPNLEMTALSATRGAFTDVKSLVSGGMTPQQIVERFLGGKLLGVIDLKQIVGFSDLPEDLPQVKPNTGATPGVSFHWAPRVQITVPDLIKPGQGGPPALVLDGTLSGSSALIIGSLKNVALTFLGLLAVDFNELTFRMQTGQSPKFGASLKSFQFDGELEFVNDLTTLLPLDGFGGSGPSVKITPEGASAGLSIAIPTIPLGPIILQNLALSAMLNLYFSDTPASVTFALSSRKDPFIVTYTVFGGGGYFAFTVDTSGAVTLEAALEFGGAASVDLVIAKGVIQAMVGIRFELKDTKARLTGYVRIYGCIEILELVAISVEFYMGLTYAPPYAVGEASLTVMVRVLAFSKSVTLHVERRFSTDGATRALADRVVESLTLDEWRNYCQAFAAA